MYNPEVNNNNRTSERLFSRMRGGYTNPSLPEAGTERAAIASKGCSVSDRKKEGWKIKLTCIVNTGDIYIDQ